MKSKLQFRVRYQETDQMGVVHHSVYYIWYEMGRTEWLREKGMTYRDCEAKGWLLPLIESGSNYLNPGRYDDLLELETEMIDEKGAIFHFTYTVSNVQTGQVLATGFTKHVLVGTDYKINPAATKQLKEALK
ncbi:MAG TPA: acyl-CoA thioesterase [Bacillota bacterium]|nr:acyl-CoA thioesterase [Bacillota bacterium]